MALGLTSLGLPYQRRRSSSVPPVAAPVNTVLPAITGTAQVGGTLTTSNGTWSNSPASYAYQWKSNGTAISGATSSTFLPTITQVGTTITCTVTATNIIGSTPATSAATSAVLPEAPVNTILPAITGTTQQGQTLTTSNGTWINSPASFAYQWRADGTSISGATASTFLLTATQVGTVISCTVTATNTGGSSPATSVDTATVTPATAPVNTVLPAITGTAQVGGTLTTSNGTWSNSPASYAYQWNAAGSPISGALSTTYVPVAGDVGLAITCTVTATNVNGSTPATSAATSAVTAASSLAAPELALVTPLTNPPTFTIVSDLPLVADVFRLQFSTDAGFASIAYEVVNTLDIFEIADLTLAMAVGSLTPAAYYARIRQERSSLGSPNSPWSNTVTFTITSVARQWAAPDAFVASNGARQFANPDAYIVEIT